MLKWLFRCGIESHLLGNFLLEAVGGFESRNVVGRDDECGVLADIAGGFLGTGLDDKRNEAAEINVFSVC